MKIPNKKVSAIVPTNSEELQTWGTSSMKDSPYWPLLQLLADMYDAIAAQEDAFTVLGATRDKSAASITMTLNGARASEYAQSLAELGERCQNLL